MVKRAVIITTLILTWLTFSTGAHAHAGLESSNPVKASILSEMPSQISLTFTEELLKIGAEKVNTVELISPNDEVLPLGPLEVEGEVLSAKVLTKSEDFISGSYKIKFRVVSADGHPVKGEIPFKLNKIQASPLAQDASDEVVDEAQTSGGFGIITLFLVIILVFSALLLIRRKR